jgi:hypothetical protein
MGITVKIQLYSLAALPVEYLTRQDALLERMRVDAAALNPYRDVFITGVRACQQHAYLELVRRAYGRNVAQQVKVYQQRLLEFSTGRGRCIEQALALIEGALRTRAVRADTREGEVEMPIEMNVALALLLGMPESPDYAATAGSRAEQIVRMQPEVDWCLAHCLACAREEMKNTFLPVVTHFEGTARSGVMAGVPE